MATPEPDRRRGDDRSLRAFYDLVPDAYELDLLEEARRPPTPEATAPDLDRVHAEFVASLGFDGTAEPVDQASPTVTQAQFLVERLLGGVIVDDQPR